jgi:hydroxypyruvate reductase
LSAIKGGKFARIIYPATSINLILSDVVGDDLDTIASGLTVRDDTTYQEAYEIIKKYGIEKKLPANVARTIMDGAGKSDEILDQKYFSGVNNLLIGTNRLALKSASEKAKGLGYDTMILTSRLTGEAREAAKFLAGIAKSIYAYGEPLCTPACVISGGETTVTLKGPGKGGRNQELALSYLSELQNDGSINDDIWLLSASTDGNDGPTDAAGAFACRHLLEAAKHNNLILNDFLKENDSYSFFEITGGHFITGPTNTNVCDIQIQLIY